MRYEDGRNVFSHWIPSGGLGDRVVGRNTCQPRWNGLVAGAKTVAVDVWVTIRAAVLRASRSDLRIKGENPTSGQIPAEATTPWYIRRMIRRESSCRQFGSDDYPLKSFDHGYGLMQLTDPQPNELEIWSWKANVGEGRERLLWMRDQARKFWDRQVTQWMVYNENNDPDVGPPPNKTYGDTTFGYDSGRPIIDAITIKRYNGATRHWLSWYNVDLPDDVQPYWSHNDSGYVEAVVLSTPCP